MHFGDVEDIANLPTNCLNLPGESTRTKAFLELNWQGRGQLYVGCPIWTRSEWVGRLFPKGTKSANFLAAYAHQFNSVEVNSTFYHLLDSKRTGAWASQVSADFRFCPKVYRGITERLDAADIPRLVKSCADGMTGFGDNFGMAFAQFPETFSPAHRELLRRFLELWPKSLPIAIELRHPAWFQDHTLLDDVVNLLYRHQAATVITDTPGRRDVLHMSLTQPRLMIRFQGHHLHPTDSMRLSQWAYRLQDWQSRGIDALYFFCHQIDEPLIPDTVNLLLNKLGELEVRAPAPWRDLAAYEPPDESPLFGAH